MGYYATSQPYFDDELDYTSNSSNFNDTNWPSRQPYGTKKSDFDDMTINGRDTDTDNPSDYSILRYVISTL